MKMKKMIGSIALTAALALGTMPAFAASVGNDALFSDNGDNTADGSTVVKAELINTQLNCTVPLEVTVVMGSNGFSELQCPSSSAYGITNNSEDHPVKLADVSIAENSSLFTMDMAVTPASEPAPSDNELALWLKVGTFKSFLSESHNFAGVSSTKDRNTADQNNVKGSTTWSKPTIAAKATLPLELYGWANMVDVDTDVLTETGMCQIVYTIEAAS